MKSIIIWILVIIFITCAYFLNPGFGFDVVTPIFRTIFPWTGAAIIFFLIGYANREKLEDWLGVAKANNGKLKNINEIKKLHIGLAWLIVAIIGSVMFFYWFGVRPEQIKKDCYLRGQNALGWSGSYEDCLQQNGLK